jgi:hypothetical protein
LNKFVSMIFKYNNTQIWSSFEHYVEYHQVYFLVEPLFTSHYTFFKCMQYTQFPVHLLQRPITATSPSMAHPLATAHPPCDPRHARSCMTCPPLKIKNGCLKNTFCSSDLLSFSIF